MAKPELPHKTTFNKAENTRRDNDVIKNIAVTLFDIDNAIMEHFANKISPYVVENEERVSVPIVYGSPERWKSVQTDGVYRDVHGKIQVPLLLYKRNSISRNDSMAMLNRYVNYTYTQRYSKKNRYERYSLMNGVIPTKEIYSVTMPDYVTLSYECVVWTEYVEQMNHIIEQIQFAVDTYWGDPNRFKFRVRIDDFANTVEVSDTEQRMVKTEFSMLVYAYLLPNKFEDYSSTTKKIFSSERIVNITEVDATTARVPPSLYGTFGRRESASTIIPATSPNVSGTTYTELFSFLALSKTIVADFVTSDDGSGNSVFKLTNYDLASTPIELVSIIVDSDKWRAYVNGVKISKSDITYVSSEDASGDGALLKFDNSSLGYSLTASDEVVAIGKFSGV